MTSSPQPETFIDAPVVEERRLFLHLAAADHPVVRVARRIAQMHWDEHPDTDELGLHLVRLNKFFPEDDPTGETYKWWHSQMMDHGGLPDGYDILAIRIGHCRSVQLWARQLPNDQVGSLVDHLDRPQWKKLIRAWIGWGHHELLTHVLGDHEFELMTDLHHLQMERLVIRICVNELIEQAVQTCLLDQKAMTLVKSCSCWSTCTPEYRALRTRLNAIASITIGDHGRNCL